MSRKARWVFVEACVASVRGRWCLCLWTAWWVAAAMGVSRPSYLLHHIVSSYGEGLLKTGSILPGMKDVLIVH